MNMFCITFLCFMIVTVAGSTSVLNEFTALQKQKDLRALFSIGLRELDGMVETLEVWQICVRISEMSCTYITKFLNIGSCSHYVFC